ncbi:hypothetical protein ACFLYO_03785 [Chloroflexota bacterium]
MTGSQDLQAAYKQASIKTADNLRTIATSAQIQQLSRLSLPEIDHLVDEIARVIPAGSVPAVILNGLGKVRGRQIDSDETRKHIGLLFKGVRQTLDEAVYATFYAGPAAVLYGYQQLLHMAGKDPTAAFPDGTWQFYLEFALREDSARHANETTGFHSRLQQYNIHLDDSDMLAAWLTAVAYFLRDLPGILANEWLEPVTLRLLAEVAEEFDIPEAAAYRKLPISWIRQRPFGRGADAQNEDYVAYRRRVFNSYLEPYIRSLPTAAQQVYTTRLQELEHSELPRYQKQLTWLAYLEPHPYKEERIHYPLDHACVGVIWQGRYYLLPIHDLFNPEVVRATVAAITTHRPEHAPAALDEVLVTARRADHVALRRRLDSQTLQELETLKHTPVLLNWDECKRNQPLAMLRQGKRGIGDHALTIFRTAESIVLDQSHIFFDGAWGAAVAEILTNEALSWGQYYAQSPLEHHQTAAASIYTPKLQVSDKVLEQARKVSIPAETSAETDAIQVRPILALRKLLKQRSDLATVTVNDLFILYRGLHATRYQPSPQLQQALDALAQETSPEARQAAHLIQQSLLQLSTKNPAILIPVDASGFNPRERLFPMTFRNPFTDFLVHHTRTLQALQAYNAQSPGSRGNVFQEFYDAQLYYLRLIGGFGELLSRYKQVALVGQSTSTTSINLLGHLPTPLQKLLDTIPSKFDVLNEVIKGDEVFSNVGRVAKGSMLKRFITAKDDNEQKTLMWGVITDDDNVVRLSLRDFRPHVTVLHDSDRHHLAQLITQDYVDAYAVGFNAYIADLRQITVASRQTMIHNKE